MKSYLLPLGLLVATLFLWSGCASTPAPTPPPHPVAYRINGNWWSDGSYRVDRRDPQSMQQFWHDRAGDMELLTVGELHAILPETIAALNAKCRAASTPTSYWLGWKMRRGNPMPVGIVCFRGRPMTAQEVAQACARLMSRGRVMEMAWRRPDEWTFACREPDLNPMARAVSSDER